jgi:very-short-patch-repair endonuclease
MGRTSPLKRELARQLRVRGTASERFLWRFLRGGRVAGLKFRRQRPLFGFIVDFYCARARLAIELDGPIHVAAVDADRDLILLREGIRVLRFKNEELERDIGAVIRRILREASEPPLPEREREGAQRRRVRASCRAKPASPLSRNGRGKARSADG